ncbi:MAG: type II secretion system protein [Magnetococcales bacterium]|nr:type II secretion system protein [Magnetococcales bacterium]
MAGAGGWSLVELIMVMVMIGILSVGVMIYSPGDDVELYNTADTLIMDYRQLQLLSMRNGGNYRFVRLSNSSYELQDSTGTPVEDATDIFPIQMSPFSNFTMDTMGVPDAPPPTITLADASGNTVVLTIYSETGSIFR